MASLVIGSTIPPFKSTDHRDAESLSWLATMEDLARHAREYGFQEVEVFAALEVDARGIVVHQKVLDRLGMLAELEGLHVEWWAFSMETGHRKVTTGNRIPRIVTGRNLVVDWAMDQPRRSHILFLDSDVEPDADCVPKLAELDRLVAAGKVDAYAFTGGKRGFYLPKSRRFVTTTTTIDSSEGAVPIHARWSTAGFLLTQRTVWNRVRWGWSPDLGMTDDPWTQGCIEAAFGEDAGRTWIREDVHGRHPLLSPLEHRGHDLGIR